MRLTPAALLPVLALSVLVACGGDDEPESAGTSSSPTSEQSSPTSAPPSASESPDASGSPGAASPGQVPRPQPGTCEPVAESADGRYVVADAGEITLRMEDGNLQLNVSSSNGWSTSVHSENSEADVEFRQGDDELDFEAEIEDGRLVLRICDDDD
ncbi:hypothetical protein SAMN05660485_02972 [Blastococcus fimeti]|nr:hypothetical protein SAMN05660485_02972 [Blastococcus fimeti]